MVTLLRLVLAHVALIGVFTGFVSSLPDEAESHVGVSLTGATFLGGSGIDDARRDFGIEGRIIVTCVRHLGPQSAINVAKNVVLNPHPYVVTNQHEKVFINEYSVFSGLPF